jgi:hypothetical protein
MTPANRTAIGGLDVAVAPRMSDTRACAPHLPAEMRGDLFRCFRAVLANVLGDGF